jgi:HD domain-containing protein
MTEPLDVVEILIKAAHFAYVKHEAQKQTTASVAAADDSNPFRVAKTLLEDGGVRDVEVLVAGMLVTVVEDSTSSVQEIRAEFGDRVADILNELREDESLSLSERQIGQVARSSTLSRDAKLVTMGHLLCNIRSLCCTQPNNWSIERCQGYLVWVSFCREGLADASPFLAHEISQILESGQITTRDGNKYPCTRTGVERGDAFTAYIALLQHVADDDGL